MLENKATLTCEIKTKIRHCCGCSREIKQETHHEMRTPERDVTYIVLSVYLLTLIYR